MEKPQPSKRFKGSPETRICFMESARRNPERHFCGAQKTLQNTKTHLRSRGTLGPDKRLFVILACHLTLCSQVPIRTVTLSSKVKERSQHWCWSTINLRKTITLIDSMLIMILLIYQRGKYAKPRPSRQSNGMGWMGWLSSNILWVQRSPRATLA